MSHQSLQALAIAIAGKYVRPFLTRYYYRCSFFILFAPPERMKTSASYNSTDVLSSGTFTTPELPTRDPEFHTLTHSRLICSTFRATLNQSLSPGR